MSDIPDYLADRPSSNACVRCRRRKQKCDGGPDCTRCKKAGVACEMRVRAKQTGLCTKCKTVAKECPEDIIQSVKEVTGCDHLEDPENEKAQNVLSMVNISPDFFAIRTLNNSSMDRCMGYLDQHVLSAFPESTFRPYVALPFWKLCTESTSFDIERLATQHINRNTNGAGFLMSTFEHLVFFSQGTMGISDYNSSGSFAAKAVVLRDILFDADSPVIRRGDMANQLITTMVIFAFTLLNLHDYIEFFNTTKLVALLLAEWRGQVSTDVAALCDTLRNASLVCWHVYKGQPYAALPAPSSNVNATSRVSRLRNEMLRLLFNLSANTYHDIRMASNVQGSPYEDGGYVKYQSAMFDFKKLLSTPRPQTQERLLEIRKRAEDLLPLLMEEESCPTAHPIFVRSLKIQLYGVLAMTQYRTRMAEDAIQSAMVCLNELELLPSPPPLTFQPFSYALKVLLDMGYHAAFLRGVECLGRFKDRKATAISPAIIGTARELTGQGNEAMSRVPFRTVPCVGTLGHAVEHGEEKDRVGVFEFYEQYVPNDEPTSQQGGDGGWESNPNLSLNPAVIAGGDITELLDSGLFGTDDTHSAAPSVSADVTGDPLSGSGNSEVTHDSTFFDQEVYFDDTGNYSGLSSHGTTIESINGHLIDDYGDVITSTRASPFLLHADNVGSNALLVEQLLTQTGGMSY